MLFEQEEIEVKNAVLNYYYILYGNNFYGFEILVEGTIRRLFKTRQHETTQEIYNDTINIVDRRLRYLKHERSFYK